MKWEYMTAEIEGYSQSQLFNALRPLGEEGWELIHYAPICIFKRPKECDICPDNAISHYCPTKEQPKECLCGLDESKGNYARMDIVCPKHDAEPTVVNNVSCNVSGCRCGRTDTHGCS